MKFSALALFAGAASAAVIGQRDIIDDTAVDIKAIFQENKCQSAACSTPTKTFPSHPNIFLVHVPVRHPLG